MGESLVWFYGISTIVGYLMPNPFLYIKTVLFQTIQFCISTQFSFIWPIDRTLSGATTLGQSAPGSNGNKGLLHIPQSSSITGASSSDCLVSHTRTLIGLAVIPPLQRCSQCILQLMLTVPFWGNGEGGTGMYKTHTPTAWDPQEGRFHVFSMKTILWKLTSSRLEVPCFIDWEKAYYKYEEAGDPSTCPGGGYLLVEI